MDVTKLFKKFVRPDISPIPHPSKHVPNDSDIEWARRQTEKLMSRAEELGIEVDIEEEAMYRQ